jgi:hypothetical protein
MRSLFALGLTIGWWKGQTAAASSFAYQFLGDPFESQYTGVSTFDLNNDGLPDLLVSAGKHWIDQTYVLINLGAVDGVPVFSDPLPLGPPGGYYQVDATVWPSLAEGHVAVLLAGGECTQPEFNQFGRCVPGEQTQALLLDIHVSATCQAPAARRSSALCSLTWRFLWQDDSSAGDRNGAFAWNLGSADFPALVLVGTAGASIFEPQRTVTNNGSQSNYLEGLPNWRLSPEEMLRQTNDSINRGTGLAVGRIGQAYEGFWVGTRTMLAAPPAPLIGVWKAAASYEWYAIQGNDAYAGAPSTTVQATDLVLADLNGDGIMDVVEANHVSALDLSDAYPVQQDYYLLDGEGFPLYGSPTPFAWEFGGGRSVDAGDLFADSTMPDLALGTGDGYVVLLENLGVDPSNGRFLGFRERHRFAIMPGCEVRDLKIVKDLARPCAPSVVAVVFCGEQGGGVYAFHETTRQCPAPTLTPTVAPALPISPDLLPIGSPSSDSSGFEQEPNPDESFASGTASSAALASRRRGGDSMGNLLIWFILSSSFAILL